METALDRLRGILVGAFALLVAGCAPFPFPERLASRASGTVVDARKRPVAGARVEYLFRGHRVLGKTVTRKDGHFAFGPFYQWFLVVYVGSPGVYPTPYTLSGVYGMPDMLRVSAQGATGIYLRGTQAQFNADSRASKSIPNSYDSIRLPSPRRWTGKDMTLTLTPEMKDVHLSSTADPH